MIFSEHERNILRQVIGGAANSLRAKLSDATIPRQYAQDIRNEIAELNRVLDKIERCS